MALKAVGFDIDGTLYPDHRAQRRSIPFFLRHLRTILAFSRTRRRMRVEASDDESGEIRLFAEELGCDADTAKDIRDNIIYRGWEGYFRGMETYTGVREALLRLRNSGLRLAAVSDFPVGRKLEYFGLDDLFDISLGFPETGRLKPHLQPFRMMAEGLGLNPEEIIYIGNKLDYDVRGAEKAGMRGALIGVSGRRIPKDVTVYPDYRRMADQILSEVTK